MKKAQMTMVLIITISVLLGGGILFVAMGNIIPALLDAISDGTCRLSAQINLGLHYLTFGKASIEMKCKRHELVFSQEDIDKGTALTKIENNIRSCWKNMLRGKSKQFNQKFFLQGNNPCIICGTIEFENPKSKTMQGLDIKLKSTRKYDPSSWSEIYEGFTSVLNLTSPVITKVGDEWKESEILTDKKYTILYKVYNPALVLDIRENTPAIIPIVSGPDLRNIKCSYFYN